LYDNNTGIAKVWVDNSVVYTYTGVSGRPLYWNNAGNVVVGTNMDGYGKNITILDNLIIKNPAASSLPLKLLSFTAAAKGSSAVLNWSTTQEVNSAGFVIERSADGASFSAIKTIAAANQYNSTSNYSYTDNAPIAPISYYRLKMMDTDGSYTYSAIVQVSFDAAKASIRCYPNPTTDYIHVQVDNGQNASYRCTVSSLDGKTLAASTLSLSAGVQQTTINLSAISAKGVLLVQLYNASNNTVESFKVVKQ
jgi:hypothetical protein